MNKILPLVSVLAKSNDKIIKNGFLASLKEITKDVRELWKPGDQIPMTLGFFKKPPQQNLWVSFGSGSCPSR